MSQLSAKKCVACAGGAVALTADQFAPLLRQLSGWEVIERHHLVKNYDFPDFKTALAFVNQIGTLAEHEHHHPDLFLSWGKVGVQIYTHKVNGLTESDFVMAAKMDELPR